MALTATVRRFEIDLADTDRGIYTSLDLRVAQHPSESERYLAARVLARVVFHADGLEFSKGGVSDDTEPALVQKDLRGDLLTWIEIGNPSVERLHRASKACRRVVVVSWKNVEQLAEAVHDAKIHRAEAVEIYAADASFLDAVAAKLDRNNQWQVSIVEGTVFATVGGDALSCDLPRVRGGEHGSRPAE